MRDGGDVMSEEIRVALGWILALLLGHVIWRIWRLIFPKKEELK